MLKKENQGVNFESKNLPAPKSTRSPHFDTNNGEMLPNLQIKFQSPYTENSVKMTNNTERKR